MDKIRQIFEGDHGTKTPNKFLDSKIYLAAAVIGSVFCLISFILALINVKTVACVIFLIALLVCVNSGIKYFKHKRSGSLK